VANKPHVPNLCQVCSVCVAVAATTDSLHPGARMSKVTDPHYDTNIKKTKHWLQISRQQEPHQSNVKVFNFTNFQTAHLPNRLAVIAYMPPSHNSFKTEIQIKAPCFTGLLG
jgi:hypothetical protein